MPLFTWQDSYSVGVDLIDHDHKLLVSLINQLNDAMETGQARDVVGSVLTVLVEYTETHFEREETLMRRGGYPKLDEHHLEHVKLTGQVRDIQRRYIAGDHSAVDGDILIFLKKWLTGHILGIDMQYKPWVEKIELSPEDMLVVFEGEDEDDNGF